jgi:hypothetical protein
MSPAKRRILIVGGGAGGASCAARARCGLRTKSAASTENSGRFAFDALGRCPWDRLPAAGRPRCRGVRLRSCSTRCQHPLTAVAGAARGTAARPRNLALLRRWSALLLRVTHPLATRLCRKKPPRGIRYVPSFLFATGTGKKSGCCIRLERSRIGV